MRTGQWKTMGIGSLIGKMIYAVFGLAASMLCIMGYYPVVPAFYTACCLDKKRNFLLYIGLVVGMGWCMPVAAIVKYLFILFVLGIAIRFYIWANRRCSGWTAGMIAGITTIAMNTSGLLILNMEKKALILGISEGVIVFALAVLFHYGIGMGSQIFRERHKNRVEQEGVETMVGMDPQGRIHAFAEAVDELSVAFAAMDGRQKPKQHGPSGYSCPGDYRKAVCGLRWMCRVFRAAETGFLDKNPPDACNLLEYLTQRDIQTKNSGVNVRYRGKHRFFKGFNEFIKEKTRRCDNDFEKIERHVFF